MEFSAERGSTKPSITIEKGSAIRFLFCYVKYVRITKQTIFTTTTETLPHIAHAPICTKFNPTFQCGRTTCSLPLQYDFSSAIERLHDLLKHGSFNQKASIDQIERTYCHALQQ